MSFKAYLNLEEEQYELTACHVIVHRKTDIKGRPASKSSWIIRVLIDSVDDTKITEWMINPHLQKDGEIDIYKPDEDASLKVISFKKAYCVGLIENFFTDVAFMKCYLQIVGEEVTIKEAKFTHA